MSDAGKGILAVVGACLIWGLSPLFYKLLAHVPPGEVLAHRTLWSLVFFAGVLAVLGRLGELGQALATGRMRRILAFAGAMVAVNWFGFILSVQIGRTTESSLGYYIYPLVAVLLGALVFGERVGGIRAVAIAFATAGVLTLVLGAGVVPVIALALAFSFGLYGVVKKRMAIGPVVSVTAEVALLAPVALLWLAGIHSGLWAEGRPGAVFFEDGATRALLLVSGPLTAAPLILFSYASRRAALSTLGLIQYLNPTLQFVCAVIVFGEPFTPWHAAAFAAIWTAVALYSLAALRDERAFRRAASSASTPS